MLVSPQNMELFYNGGIPCHCHHSFLDRFFHEINHPALFGTPAPEIAGQTEPPGALAPHKWSSVASPFDPGRGCSWTSGAGLKGDPV